MLAQVLWSHARVLRLNYPDLQLPDIQDLVHDVLLKLQSIDAMRRIRAAHSVEGYLFVVLRNAANDVIRRRKSAKLVQGDILGSLEEADLQLFQMRFSQNMSIADIAIHTDTSYSIVAAKLFRMLYRLRLQTTDVERRIYYEELYQQLPMNTILKDLTEEERELIQLHIIEERSTKEIAKLLNKDVKEVRWEWNKLSAKLRTRARSVRKKGPEML